MEILYGWEIDRSTYRLLVNFVDFSIQFIILRTGAFFYKIKVDEWEKEILEGAEASNVLYT